MLAFFSALAHLLWHSVSGLVGGWMGTTILALAVGLLINQVGPRLDAWYHGVKYVSQPKRVGTLLITIGTWFVLFSASVVSTVYRDHVSLVSEDRGLTAQNSTDEQQLRRDTQQKQLDVSEISDLQNRLAVFTTLEPQDSLRRRTIRLASDLDVFDAKRWAGRPATAGEVDRQYEIETERLYVAEYKSRTMGILQELRAKGLDVGLLDAEGAAQVRPLGGEEIRQLRDLAFHLDAHDQVINFMLPVRPVAP